MVVQDADGSGFIDMDELGVMLRELGMEMSKKQVHETMERWVAQLPHLLSLLELL